jgi:hypothetical protein
MVGVVSSTFNAVPDLGDWIGVKYGVFGAGTLVRISSVEMEPIVNVGSTVYTMVIL